MLKLPSTPPKVPVLETERLVLRGHTLDDYEDCVSMWTDPGVTKFIGGKPSTREEVWLRMLRYPGHWALLGFGYWVIRERGTNKFVGEIGLADFHRDIEPAIDAPETGWALSSWAHGKGLATEALKGVLAWSDAHLSKRTLCLIDPSNKPSLRVAEKVGYRELRQGIYKGHPSIIFERR
jgi:RimJ/RimL family protein N-acetyltransferase